MRRDNTAPDALKPTALIVTWLTLFIAMLSIDIVWLGLVAQEFYNESLGPLRSPEVHWPAALGFYAFYVTFILVGSIIPSLTMKQAAWRGAAMGLFAYGTYELTNWAVLAAWPAALVLPDILWGVFLTSTVAALSHIPFKHLQYAKSNQSSHLA